MSLMFQLQGRESLVLKKGYNIIHVPVIGYKLIRLIAVKLIIVCHCYLDALRQLTRPWAEVLFPLRFMPVRSLFL